MCVFVQVYVLSMCVHMCLCCVCTKCVHIFMLGVHACVFLQLRAGTGELMWWSEHNLVPLFETVLTVVHCCGVRLDGPIALWILLSLPPISLQVCWSYRCMHPHLLYVASRDLSSSCQPCCCQHTPQGASPPSFLVIHPNSVTSSVLSMWDFVLSALVFFNIFPRFFSFKAYVFNLSL